jgi:NO-binding membrane sensor protein with MHYT domain
MILETSFLFIFGFGALALSALFLWRTKLKGYSIVLAGAGIAAVVILFVRWGESSEFWALTQVAVLIVAGGAVALGILGVSALLIETRSR